MQKQMKNQAGDIKEINITTGQGIMNNINDNKLNKWGWNSFFESGLKRFNSSDLKAGRIIRETRHLYQIAAGDSLYNGEISGAFRYKAVSISDFPVIGDWILFRRGDEELCIIEEVLTRKSSFSRKTAGEKTEEQIIAANIDYIGLVFGIHGGRNFTEGALERYVTLAWESGAVPVIILNKADLADDDEREKAVITAEYCAPGVDIYTVSARTGEGVEDFISKLKPGTTIAFTGPSGVGKSTLINTLAGEQLQKTNAQREGDLKGVHTTSHRELFLLDSGLMLIDSPGLKEVQLWAGEESAFETFSDITEFAAKCRFKDCSHQGEPGCAVQGALLSGELEYRRYENYLDLMREINYLKTRIDAQAAKEKKEKWKNIAKLQKNLKKNSKRTGL